MDNEPRWITYDKFYLKSIFCFVLFIYLNIVVYAPLSLYQASMGEDIFCVYSYFFPLVVHIEENSVTNK